jgi:hypothetical protein
LTVLGEEPERKMTLMEEDGTAMPCPFLEEIVMVYCRAYPVRKLVPKHQITTTSPCTGEGYTQCSLFKEIMARLEAASGERPGLIRREVRKEVK